MSRVETFGDYAQAGAPTIARVFLPLVDQTDVSKTATWSELEGDGSVELSGDVSWSEYLGWGTGRGSFESSWRPSMGRAPSETIQAVAALLTNFSGPDSYWEFKPFPEITPMTEISPKQAMIDLPTFAHLWVDRPMPGSLSYRDVALSAPTYADSVIISGPSSLIEVGKTLGLEIRTVGAREILPSMVW